MREFLLEILSEDIPARMQVQAAQDLKRLVIEQLTAAGLTFETRPRIRRLAGWLW